MHVFSYDHVYHMGILISENLHFEKLGRTISTQTLDINLSLSRTNLMIEVYM